MTAFMLPDLGEGLREAEIVAWHVVEGDHVVADQPLLSVETEKAVVEIPSPRSGYIAGLLVRPGERVQVGAPIVEFADDTHADAGTVVGELAAADRPAPRAKSPARAASTPRAAPAVRVRAHTLGVELSRVTPTGPGGTVTLADVEQAAVMTHGEAVALRGARRTMAANMARAGRAVVPATLQDEADVECWNAGEDVTIRLVRAVIAACSAEPALNAAFDGEALSVRRHAHVDLGVAIDSPDGLFVPVLRNVAKSTPEVWRAQIEDAKKGVEQRSLSPAVLQGPTITLSNFGTIAGRHGALVIMPPQVAIVGAGRIRDAAVRAGTGLAVHRMLPLSLTFDHRAVTGGEAARFLRALIGDLEKSE